MGPLEGIDPMTHCTVAGCSTTGLHPNIEYLFNDNSIFLVIYFQLLFIEKQLSQFGRYVVGLNGNMK
jgi:hypothetical protein